MASCPCRKSLGEVAVLVFRVKFTDGDRFFQIDVKAMNEGFAAMRADQWADSTRWRRVSVTRVEARAA